MGGVCCSMRSAAVKDNSHESDKFQIPWLMLPREPSIDKSLDDVFFVNISEGVSRSRVFLPEAYKDRCFSCKDWLLTVSEDLSMCLLHPESYAKIQLPRLNKFQKLQLPCSNPYMFRKFITKFALSETPNSTTSTNYCLMTIYGELRKLGFWKQGDECWTIIDEGRDMYRDVVFYRDRFYALDSVGRIVACDIGNDIVTVRVAAIVPEGLFVERPCYLVESGGALLVVSRMSKRVEEWPVFETCEFQIFQPDLDTNTWTKVTDLGDRTLFLGYNSSFSVDGFRGKNGNYVNCIFFTDDNGLFPRQSLGGDGYDTVGYYNLKDGSVHRKFWGNFCNPINPPMWFVN